nr:ESPR-type extended signal peptide-containing protein [Stenotrophomonas maltophilia]
MNRIYRLIWNTALGCWTVASEHTKGRGKRASGAATVAAVAALVLSMPVLATEPSESEEPTVATRLIVVPEPILSPFSAGAIVPRAVGILSVHNQSSITSDSSYRNSTLTGDHSIVLGSRSSVAGGNATAYGNQVVVDGRIASAFGFQSVARGIGATALGAHAIAYSYGLAAGIGSKATGTFATALGNYTTANGDNSLAAGRSSVSSGAQSLALGYLAEATGNYTIAIGNETKAPGYSSIAMGAYATTAASHSIAIGDRASVASAAANGVALGKDATLQAAASNAVALGSGSVAASSNSVSVGNATLKRKIVNVDDGAISANSSEAVTGKQLYATSSKLVSQRTAIGQNAEATGSSDTAIGYGAKATGTYSNAMGYGTTTAGANAVAIGTLAKGAAGGAVSLGNRAEVDVTSTNGTALGSGAKVSGSAAGAVALGNGSIAAAANTVSVGTTTLKRKIVNVGDGLVAAGSTEAVTGNQLHATNESLGKVQGLITEASANGTVRLGIGNTGNRLDVRNQANANRVLTGLADGAVTAGSTEAVTGKQLHATNATLGTTTATANTAKTTAEAARDNAATALDKANLTGGLVGQVSPTGNVRLGAENTGTSIDVRNKSNAARKLSGVADAALSATSTEAVTGKQLHATNATLGTTTTTANTAKATAEAARDNAATALDKANLTGGLVGQVSPTGNVRLGAENTGTSIDVRNKSNAARKLSGVADAALSATSTEAVTGKQLHATNATLGTTTTTANTAKATAEAARDNAAAALDKANLTGGLVGQVSPTGNVRLGAENTGTSIDVRNKSNAARKLSGVADAALSATSTEAVTGKQLFNTDGKVKLADDKAVAAQSTADGAKGDAASALQRIASSKAIIGTSATAAGSNANAMGYEAQAGGSHSNAVGFRAKAAGANAVGLGTMVDAAADDAIAMGNRTVVDAGAKGGIALGAGAKVEAGASNGVALGQGSVAASGNAVSVGNATTKRKIVNVADGLVANNSNEAITGSQLKTTNDLIAAQAAAVSANAEKIDGNRSSIEGNLAGIGTNRTGIETNRTGIDNNRTGIVTNRTSIDTNRANIGVNRDDIAALRSDFEGFVPDLEGAVTFNEDRTIVDLDNARISGLSAGDISHAGSKDAVNGGQLFATNTRVNSLEEQHRFLFVSSDAFSEAATAGRGGVAIGDSAEASIEGEGGTAVGSFSKAQASNSVALGRAAHVQRGADGGFALGTRSLVEVTHGVALGTSSEVKAGATNSIALGYRSIATEADSLSIGNDGATGLKRRIVNVGRGTRGDSATTVAQLQEAVDGLGGGATVDVSGTVTRPEYVLSRGTHDNVGSALLALDSAITTTTSDIDALGNHVNRLFQEEASTRTDGAGRLALGGEHGMVLGNVADGRIGAGSRDAVNGGQLHATNQKVGENRSEIFDLRAALDGMQPRTARSLMLADAPVVDFGGSRLAGVGAGDISSADSKDAVNGGQLFATNERLEKVAEGARYVSVGYDEESVAAQAGFLAIAIGDNAEASLDTEGAVAVGSYAVARGRDSVALGRAAYVHAGARQGFALGPSSHVEAANGMALGASSVVEEGAFAAVAIGYGSIATESNTISVGNSTTQRRIVNVANGTANQDAATVGQLKRIASVFGGSVDANGNPVTPSFNVQGGEHRTVGDALTALDTSVEDNEKSLASLDRNFNRLFQEDPTPRTDGPGRLNLGGAHGMVLGNVANGLIASGSRDAVNGGQLYEVQKNLQGQIDTLEGRGTEPVAMMSRMGAPVAMSADAPVTTSETAPAPSPAPVETPVAKVDTPEPVVKAEGDTAVAVGSEGKERSIRHVAKGTADTDAVNVRQLNEVLDRANEYTDLAVEGLNKRLDGMDKRFNRMAAMSSAQSAMAMNTAGLNTYNRLGAGVGHSDGESALAVGYQRVMNERGSATFSLNGAFTNSGEKTVGVGVGIGW